MISKGGNLKTHNIFLRCIMLSGLCERSRRKIIQAYLSLLQGWLRAQLHVNCKDNKQSLASFRTIEEGMYCRNLFIVVPFDLEKIIRKSAKQTEQN